MTFRLLYAFPEPLPLARARGVQAIHTVSELARAGLEVALFHVPGAGDPFDGYGISRPGNLNVTSLSRSLPWPLQRVHSNRFFLWRLAACLGEEWRHALVMVRHLKLAALMLRRWPRVHLVYEAHEVFSDTAPPEKRSARRTEESLVLRKAALVVANSQATAARLTELYAPEDPIAVVPNGVDWPTELPMKNWSAASAQVVYAGSLFPWKGVADLVRAAGDLPGFTIQILGGDPARVEALARTLPAHGAEVVFRGQVPHAAVASALQEACIAVLPNRAGTDSGFTSPIKLFEYMAAGCAIVASDLGPMREVLGPEEAIWVPPGDASALAAGIREIASDPDRARQMGERVRAKAQSFTWAGRARRLKELMESL